MVIQYTLFVSSKPRYHADFNLSKVVNSKAILSYLVPLFQNEFSCKSFLMKISLICVKMNLWAEPIP